ncbi:MAG TPA: murein L,D-transpeptidase catalytic domain family protein [Longimicrobium sp.]|nr:murein L,D-transpeptidase catalytic domain family protein [Longimicrobium sp.]
MSDHEYPREVIPDSEDVAEGEEAPEPENIAANEEAVRDRFRPGRAGASHGLGLGAAKAAPANFGHLDPGKVVPAGLLQKAIEFFTAHANEFDNQSHISVLDYSMNSSKRRLHVIDMASGQVQSLFVANGIGSEPVHNGKATRFGNEPGSNMSSLGFVRTAETYQGKHGLSLRLDGLSGASNSNMRKRAVVVHGADYVHDSAVVQGRSNGCPAVSMSQINALIGKIKGGSLMFFGQSAG